MKKLTIVLLFVIALNISEVVWAQTQSSDSATQVTSTPKPTKTPEPTKTPKPEETPKVEDTKELNCQKLKTDIKKDLLSLTNVTQAAITKLDKTLIKTTKYYNEKLATQGKTIEGFDSLVNQLKDDREALKRNLQETKQKAATVNCPGENLKGELLGYKSQAGAVFSLMKKYKADVKLLAEAVKEAKKD